jgi:hypothetical protein
MDQAARAVSGCVPESRKDCATGVNTNDAENLKDCHDWSRHRGALRRSIRENAAIKSWFSRRTSEATVASRFTPATGMV